MNTFKKNEYSLIINYIWSIKLLQNFIYLIILFIYLLESFDFILIFFQF